MVSCSQAEDWTAALIKGKKPSRLKVQLLSQCGGDLIASVETSEDEESTFDTLQRLADAMPFKRRMGHQ